MKQAKKAGAKMINPAQRTFWGGYGGYFKYIDGHLWEIGQIHRGQLMNGIRKQGRDRNLVTYVKNK